MLKVTDHEKKLIDFAEFVTYSFNLKHYRELNTSTCVYICVYTYIYMCVCMYVYKQERGRRIKEESADTLCFLEVMSV